MSDPHPDSPPDDDPHPDSPPKIEIAADSVPQLKRRSSAEGRPAEIKAEFGVKQPGRRAATQGPLR